MASNTTRRVNWWFVIAGLVLVICGIVIFAAPGIFLEFLTIWAGVGFLVSGIAGIISYIQLRRLKVAAGWDLFMAILDLVAGLMLILHPFAFAPVLPWLLGAVFIVFGIAEVAGIMPFRALVPEVRTMAIISGILSIIVGIMFIVWPASLSIWVAAFAIVRGVTLAAMGLTSRAG